MIVKLLLVFVGGGLGSVARFLVSLFVPKVRLSLCSIPLSTLCVNVLGCLAIGFLAACFASQPSESKTTPGRRILRRLHNLFDLFVGMYRIFESSRLCLGRHLHDCLFGFVHTIHTLRSISVKIGDVIFLFDRQRVIKQKQKFLSFALDFYLGAMSIFANGNILAR